MASECRAPGDRAHSPSLPCQCAKDAAASISIKADFTRILLDIAYNDQSSVTAHRSPQALAGGDHPPARKSPWLVEVWSRSSRIAAILAVSLLARSARRASVTNREDRETALIEEISELKPLAKSWASSGGSSV